MIKSAAWFSSQNPELVTIRSYDGLKLSAYFLPAAEGEDHSRNSILLMHGYHSSGLRDFACIYEFFHNKGWNVLLPDERAHGNSEGNYLTFGIRERFDTRDWARYLDKRVCGKQQLWIMGISMGASSVLMSLDEGLPATVCGAIADCGFTRPYEMIRCSIRRDYHLWSLPIMGIANLFGRIISGFDFKEYSVPEALKYNRIPVLFVHGRKDDFVPFEMSKENYAACTAPKMFLETNTVHAISFVAETERYTAAITEFLDTCCGSV
jgi:pimeloyl-ACP methyl ester carboxylesterase